ncbi:MAG: NAD(P)-dependent alcohol dehydrogenase, partial [Candidatus Dormibacteraeota bacterium]|nr:NAD(P)-dependent alcohol dehydrogenase [Candidatus Dormibacteraeota bacterium]
MLRTRGYAAAGPSSPLAPFEFDRRDPGPHDAVVTILHCGVCHSDIHQARDEWGGAIFPMVPGHEIVGRVEATGDAVTKWNVGDTVGVGVFVDSCRHCEACLAGEEQYCERGMSLTYNGREQDGRTPTFGGYSERIVVDESYVLRIPEGMPLDGTAPLLCAGITTYSPIRHFGVRAGDRAAVGGLGGLGHMAVKFLHALDAEVTVLSHSAGKRDDALRLGADDFAVTTTDGWSDAHQRRFDFIIDTVSAQHPYTSYLPLLRRDGVMVLVGLPPPAPLDAGALIGARRRLAGSNIGGIREIQEMLDFCAEHGITSDIESIGFPQVNEAF